MSRTTGRPDRVLMVTILACLLLPAAAAADWIGPYFPLWVGNSWTYENVDPPGDFYTESVFAGGVYDDDPVSFFGAPGDYTVIANTGRVITVYAQTEEGVLVDFDPHIVIGEFSDGSYFEICAATPCDSNLIRDWEAIDPAFRAIYDVDAEYDDVIVLISYDRDYPPNLHNIMAASNLPPGATPPAGAVTGLEWYQRGLGLVASADVDAQSGGLAEFYVLVDHYVGVDDRVDLPAVARLAPAYPNPFNPRTAIAFALARAAMVSLEIRDVAGRPVRSLVSGERAAGGHVATWDGRDDAGRGQPSGVYFACLETGGVRRSVKLVLAR